ncbi:MAG: bi-domain-containing oxidoreductase [Nanoarchaeota archaeon]
MRQLFYHNVKGIMFEEFPRPTTKPRFLVVETKSSLISRGPELAVVAPHLIKPDEIVDRSVKSIQQEGVKATIEKAVSRVEALSPLGYSASGTVIEQQDTDFTIGERVACAGHGYASHGDYMLIPKNLAIHIPEHVSFEEASFTSAGAMALQGVRRLNPQLGETVVVLGMGLIGQLCCQLLKANGCKVIGIDTDEEKVLFANKHWGIEGTAAEPVHFVLNKTGGIGCDGVLIAASEKESRAINDSFHMARKKGKVVVLGDVGLELERAQLYAKELDVKVSCSYGPGRFDESYEEQGIDYPIGYVRWTEKRNMQAFLELVAAGKVNLKPLITQTFPFEKAKVAYAFIEKNKNFGVLFSYGKASDETMFHTNTKVLGVIKTAIIGAGSYAKKVILPTLAKMDSFALKSVVTKEGLHAKEIAKRFKFENYSTDYHDVLEDHDLIMIATRHDIHAELVVAAAKAGKAIFCEKPLALTEEELQQVVAAVKEKNPFVMLGYNRRFSPFIKKMQDVLSKDSGPTLITYRISKPMPEHEWLLDRKVGGGTVIGDACNQIDLINHLIGMDPVEVTARHTAGNPNNFVAIIKYADGSIATLIYTIQGNDALAAEYLELFKNKTFMVLDDFVELTINDKVETLKRPDRGRTAILSYLSDVLTGKTKPDFGFREGVMAALTAIRIDDALKTGSPQRVDIVEILEHKP